MDATQIKHGCEETGCMIVERSGLGETIDSLERDYFGAPTESPAARDLGPIVDRWLARAVNGLANGTPHR